MKPIPAPKSATVHTSDGGMPALPSPLVTPTGEYSASNRRASPACGAQRAYPWLLFFSTAVAAVFCLLYITKPVIIPAPAMIGNASEAKIQTVPLSGKSLPRGTRFATMPYTLTKATTTKQASVQFLSVR